MASTRPRLELTRYGQPYTYANVPPQDLPGLVNVRPYYRVPTGRCWLSSARSPWTVPAYVDSVTTFGDMVRVTIHHDFDGPWKMQSIFYPHELHQPNCGCAACKGDGIHKLHGA